MERAKKSAKLPLIILGTLFPPILLLMLYGVLIRPAWRGKVPEGSDFVSWVLALAFWGALLNLPLGNLTAFSQAMQNPGLCLLVLAIDVFIAATTTGLILLTVRNLGFPNPLLPLRKFKIDGITLLLMFLSFYPAVAALAPEVVAGGLDRLVHPMLLAFVGSLKAGSTIGVILGVLSVGLIGPLFEEFVFRGLLLEQNHESERSSATRWFIDGMVCLFFASLHLPVSFVFPFLFSAVMIFIRRRSGSLFPSVLMHCIWNSSLLYALATGVRAIP